ncbi:MAG: 2-dehydropantoate 2-reductase [Gaiellales bacterium]
MIAVLGIGGVGGMLAARTGAVCVASEQTTEAITVGGLRLATGSDEIVVEPRVVTGLIDPVALLVVAVKALALPDALARIAPEAVAGAVVLPLLNGLEHLEAIRAAFPATTVVAGSIGRFEGFSPEPGRIVQRTPGALVTAGSDAMSADDLRAALDPLVVPGVDLVVGLSEREVLWEKAARLAVLAAATVATGWPVGELRNGSARVRLETALAEACAVAQAEGVTLAPTAQWAIIETMDPELTTSAARDAAAGRETELDAITGAVVRAGRRLGVPTPELAALLYEAEAACRAR